MSEKVVGKYFLFIRKGAVARSNAYLPGREREAIVEVIELEGGQLIERTYTTGDPPPGDGWVYSGKGEYDYPMWHRPHEGDAA
jgi:hypothetical protein